VLLEVVELHNVTADEVLLEVTAVDDERLANVTPTLSLSHAETH